MNKFEYIVHTLSRTIKKDYENYVVNAIYNRIGNIDLVPVTQQYVVNPKKKGGYYLIDLYFPQLNIGIECDEAYHLWNQQHDKERELTIVDVLKGIRSDDYICKRINVSLNDYDKIEEEINDVVAEVKQVIKERADSGKPISWKDVFPDDDFAHIKEKGYIEVSDAYPFPTITAVDNKVFGKDTHNQQNTWYSLRNGMKAWFPKISVDGKKARSRGWLNVISLDGMTMEEHNKNNIDVNQNYKIKDAPKRVTFANSMDPVSGIWGYRFVGIFEQVEVRNGITIYKRISDRFDLLTPDN